VLFKIIWVLKTLSLMSLILATMLLPVIVMQLYSKIAYKGHELVDPGTYYQVERIKDRIFWGGYAILIVTFLFISAPSHAMSGPLGINVPVNAATVFRIRCKRTPPELRSPKCIKLVGTR
jgi:hypothetical protein